MARPCGRERAGNGTRTRDPNLGKVVLYQLSYSRVPPKSNRPVGLFLPTGCPPDRPSARSGGEGDRTPDLVNAIHALSQLSYAPVILSRPRMALWLWQHGNVAEGHPRVKPKGLRLKRYIFRTMRKKKQDGEELPKRASKRPPDTSTEAFSADRTTAARPAHPPP